MGTKVQKSYLPGYNPMNDINDNSNIFNWPLFYQDKSVCGPYNRFFQTPTPKMYVGDEKDVVKLTMLEHEAIFKNQVYELHRLYGIQRDMMDEIKQKKIHESQIRSRNALENVQKCYFTSNDVAYSSINRQSMSVVEEIHSSLSPMMGNDREVGRSTSPNESIVKEFDRPKKSRKMLDLQLPAEEYVDRDEDEQTQDKKTFTMSDCMPNYSQTIEFAKHNDKGGCSILGRSDGFGDLDEPLQLEETNLSTHEKCTRQSSFDGKTRNINLSLKPMLQLLSLSSGNNHDVETIRNGRGIYSNVLEAGNIKDIEKSKWLLSSKPILGFLNKKAERKDGPKNADISFHYQVSPDFKLDKSVDSSVAALPTSSNLVAQSNSFLHDFSSGFKDGTVDHSSTSYDYPMFISNNNRVFEKVHEASNYFDMNSRTAINSNVARSSSSSHWATPHLAFTIEDRKAQNEKHQPVIPWLKAIHSSMNEAENSRRLLNDGEISFAHERSLGPGSKKILGFTIFDESRISKTKAFSVTSPSATKTCPPSEYEREDWRKIRAPDINLPCDPSAPDTETVKNHTVSSSRHQIDLNICLSDDEDVFDIDLEAPVVPELIQNILVEEVENLGELVIIAAKALVSISSCKNPDKDEEYYSKNGSLSWFVDIALSDESTTERVDHFEAMTLSLKEITEEEFMPRPPFPDDIRFSESVNFSQTRARRGQPRRCRQQRDFQRDILPGLTTLSRHEVTEDLQAFSDLMMATGHSFPGLTRRNFSKSSGDSGRGRRKAVVTRSPFQNARVACKIEAEMEARSLAGWGKTTRRPRRHRIPAGNLNVVAFS